jgi:hypothetical protein
MKTYLLHQQLIQIGQGLADGHVKPLDLLLKHIDILPEGEGPLLQRVKDPLDDAGPSSLASDVVLLSVCG